MTETFLQRFINGDDVVLLYDCARDHLLVIVIVPGVLLYLPFVRLEWLMTILALGITPLQIAAMTNVLN
jgi:hypothetical protein